MGQLAVRELAEERAAKQGKKITSCQSVKKDVIRNIDIMTLSEGGIYRIPENYHLYEMPITGSTNTYICIFSEDGVQIPLGVITRGAKPANGDAYVKPSGTVVQAAQRFSSLDAFLNLNKGMYWKFESYKSVQSLFRGQEDSVSVKVWTINYVDENGNLIDEANLPEGLRPTAE